MNVSILDDLHVAHAHAQVDHIVRLYPSCTEVYQQHLA